LVAIIAERDDSRCNLGLDGSAKNAISPTNLALILNDPSRSKIRADNGLFSNPMSFPLLRRETCLNTLFFSRWSIDGWFLTGNHQKPHSRLFVVMLLLMIDLDPQAFSRRLPWHPQGVLVFPPRKRECAIPPFLAREFAWSEIRESGLRMGIRETILYSSQ
jgi:hypothetical protein